MRIKKTSETRALAGTILNAQNSSTTDTYSCDYVNKLNTYSTTEQRVGTWIDGKPIYRKVITGALTDNQKIFDNVDTLINAYGTVSMDTNIRQLGYYELSGSNAYFCQLRKASSNIYFTCFLNGSSYNPQSNKLIFEYTKTTD